MKQNGTKTIGFVGAGHIGQGLTRLVTAKGLRVIMSNSRGPKSLEAIADELGVKAGTVDEAVRDSDIVVVTVPLNRLSEIDPHPFRNRIVIDTCNYYPTRDGRVVALDEHQTTTSQMVQQHFSSATVVKAFNAIMACDLVPPFGLPGVRRALPIAGDDQAAVRMVMDLHESIGFDPVNAGSLAESWRFERAKQAYCIPMDREHLIRALEVAERDVELPHNSWKRADR